MFYFTLFLHLYFFLYLENHDEEGKTYYKQYQIIVPEKHKLLANISIFYPQEKKTLGKKMKNNEKHGFIYTRIDQKSLNTVA